MAASVSDEAFAQHLLRVGVASLEQLEREKRIQAEAGKQGKPLPLGQALVMMGILTPTLRENLEKAVRGPEEGNLGQIAHYRLLKKLGKGGMGTVFLAEDSHVGRRVALKVLAPEMAADPQFLSRFKREAIAAGKLNHVNIAGAYTFDQSGQYHYYVMEYSEGEPLSKVLERSSFLPEEEALKIVMQVARGLKHAHEQGIIHRDIKPGNIFLTQDGVAKILDLGLSKNLAGAGESFHTMSGIAVGTPHYISPEQARGEKGIDARTDIYSLGATFYHLVTGATPFQASTGAAIMLKHLTAQVPNPQDLNPDLSDGTVQIITRMMAKSPNDRYPNCAELLQDLELVIDGQMPSSVELDAIRSSVAVRQSSHPAKGDDGARPARRRSSGHVPVGAVEVSAPPRPPGRRSSQQKILPAERRDGPAAPQSGRAPSRARQGPYEENEYPVEGVPPPSRKTLWMLLGLGGTAALLLVALIIVLSGGDAPPAATKKDPSAKTLKSAAPAPPQAPPPASTKTTVVSARPTGAALEAEASEKLDKLFQGVSERDTDARAARVEAFLRDYGETIAGARAKVLLEKLRKGPSLPPDSLDPPTPVRPAGKAQPSQPLKLVIVKAMYGALPDGAKIDVTDKIKALVTTDGLTVKVSKDNLGDPAANAGRKLKVDFILAGQKVDRTVNDGETLTISLKVGKLMILKAEYGDLPDGPRTDVTTKVQEMVKDAALSVDATNDNFGDPVLGTFKKLKVDYVFDRVRKVKEVAENKNLAISNKGE
jgi:serine/threonine protein kinase